MMVIDKKAPTVYIDESGVLDSFVADRILITAEDARCIGEAYIARMMGWEL